MEIRRENRECAVRQRVSALKPPVGLKPCKRWSKRSNGPENGTAGIRSSRPGTLTSEWWFGERTVVPSERKVATRNRLRAGSTSSGLGSIDPCGCEKRVGELTRIRSGKPVCNCSVPCMPAESKAVNQVTWNHFFFCAAGDLIVACSSFLARHPAFAVQSRLNAAGTGGGKLRRGGAPPGRLPCRTQPADRRDRQRQIHRGGRARPAAGRPRLRRHDSHRRSARARRRHLRSRATRPPYAACWNPPASKWRMANC